MHCTQCGHEVAQNHQFCSNCGNAIGQKKHQHRPTGNRARPRFTPALETAEGKARYDQIQAQYAWTEKWVKRVLFTLALFSVCIGIFVGSVAPHGNETLTASSIMAGFVCLMVALFYSEGLMTQDEYYSIPGASDERGHRCIFCGHHGIYRKGQYRSNMVIAQCSKCNTSFWKEFK